MDGTGKLFFSVIKGKNCLWFQLSMMRFDNKATRAKRCLNDKLAAFHKI